MSFDFSHIYTWAINEGSVKKVYSSLIEKNIWTRPESTWADSANGYINNSGTTLSENIPIVDNIMRIWGLENGDTVSVTTGTGTIQGIKNSKLFICNWHNTFTLSTPYTVQYTIGSVQTLGGMPTTLIPLNTSGTYESMGAGNGGYAHWEYNTGSNPTYYNLWSTQYDIVEHIPISSYLDSVTNMTYPGSMTLLIPSDTTVYLIGTKDDEFEWRPIYDKIKNRYAFRRSDWTLEQVNKGEVTPIFITKA